MPKPPFLVALLLLLISSTPSPAAWASSFLCNNDHYTAGGPFAFSLAYLFSDLIVSGSARPGNDYYKISRYPGAYAYGRSLCSGSLTVGDCSSCLRSAVAVLKLKCGTAIGGQAVIGEYCGVRYEQYEF